MSGRRVSRYEDEQQKIARPNFRREKLFLTGSFDIPFFAFSILLLTIGLIMLFSASYPYAYYHQNHNSYYFFVRQLIFAVAGVVAMLIMSKINYRKLRPLVKPVFVVSILLLIVVLFYHTNVGGFKRWIPMPGFTLQPSDIAKFAIILTFAGYISKYYSKMSTMKYGFLFPVLIIGAFCGLIFLENHLSCTILMFGIGICLMWLGGTDWRLFALGIGIVIAVSVVVINNPDILPEYASKRIIAWTDKSYQPTGDRWQTNNSLYAIGSGGLFGVGLGNSKQKYLYVSEPQNDFIFSIVCEELGFVGATIIILLFAALVVSGVMIARKCRDRFGKVLVTGVVAQIGLQVAFNILVVTDMFPNTGIALPFFSYGGTAVLMLLFEIGVVLSVSRSSNQLRDDDDEDEPIEQPKKRRRKA